MKVLYFLALFSLFFVASFSQTFKSISNTSGYTNVATGVITPYNVNGEGSIPFFDKTFNFPYVVANAFIAPGTETIVTNFSFYAINSTGGSGLVDVTGFISNCTTGINHFRCDPPLFQTTSTPTAGAPADLTAVNSNINTYTFSIPGGLLLPVQTGNEFLIFGLARFGPNQNNTNPLFFVTSNETNVADYYDANTQLNASSSSLDSNFTFQKNDPLLIITINVAGLSNSPSTSISPSYSTSHSPVRDFCHHIPKKTGKHYKLLLNVCQTQLKGTLVARSERSYCCNNVPSGPFSFEWPTCDKVCPTPPGPPASPSGAPSSPASTSVLPTPSQTGSIPPTPSTSATQVSNTGTNTGSYEFKKRRSHFHRIPPYPHCSREKFTELCENLGGTKVLAQTFNKNGGDKQCVWTCTGTR